MKSSKKRLDLLSILLLCVAGLLVLYVLFRFITTRVQDQQITAKAKKVASESSNGTTDTVAIRKIFAKTVELVGKYGGDQNLAILLVGQAIHESSEKGQDGLYHPFTSHVAIANNNIFGMRQPQVRDTTSLGEKGGYASYDSFDSSIEDRLMYQRARELTMTGNAVDNNGVKAWVKVLKDKAYFEANYIQYVAGVWAGVQTVKSLIQAG